MAFNRFEVTLYGKTDRTVDYNETFVFYVQPHSLEGDGRVPVEKIYGNRDQLGRDFLKPLFQNPAFGDGTDEKILGWLEQTDATNFKVSYKGVTVDLSELYSLPEDPEKPLGAKNIECITIQIIKEGDTNAFELYLPASNGNGIGMEPGNYSIKDIYKALLVAEKKTRAKEPELSAILASPSKIDTLFKLYLKDSTLMANVSSEIVEMTEDMVEWLRKEFYRDHPEIDKTSIF